MTAQDGLSRKGGEHAELPRRWSALFLAVGIACGLGAHLFIDLAGSYAWQFGPPLGILIGALAFCLTVQPRRWVAAAAGSAGLALLLGLLTTLSVLRFGSDAEWSRSFQDISLIAEALIIAQIAVPFLQTWLERGRFPLPYERLFAHAWNNSLIVALSAAFTGFFWLILWLFALLFGYVGFDQLEQLIEQPAFAWPASTAVAALGIYAGRDYSHIVVAVRRIVFSLFSVLTPLYLVLSLAFAVALAAGGFEKLSAVTSATATLITLLIIGIVLFNAVLRDGTPEAEANALLRRCALLLPPALLALCVFAAYGIYLRIGQYGLTPERVWVAAAIAGLAFHCLAYAAALAARGGWTRMSRRANVGVAGAVALIALALQTPLADPYRLSAESQYQRLVSGVANPETFDYGFLKFGLGNAGAKVLERIANDSGAAPREVVERKLDLLDRIRHSWEWQRERPQPAPEHRPAAIRDRDLVQRVPDNLQLPDDLDNRSGSLGFRPETCGRQSSKTCLITAIDLTDSPGPEYLYAAINPYNDVRLFLLEKTGGEWQSFPLRNQGDGWRIFQALLEGRYEAVAANHQDIKIGEEIIRLRVNP